MTDIHISLDLETLSTRPDGVILAIGAAAMDNGELTTFCAFCNTQQGSRHIDPSTIDWWKKQGDLWVETMERSDASPSLDRALADLQTWIASLGTDEDRLYVWGNGAGFDVAMLEHAYKAAGQQPPWAFWSVRDLRTLKHLAEDKGVFRKPERAGTHHDARDDAVYQLQMILDHWPKLAS